MSINAILIVLLSAVIHVAWNYVAKASRSPRDFFALVGVPIVLLAIGMAFMVDIGQLPSRLLWLSLVSGVVHAVYFFALASAYANASVSFVYPIVRSAPALIPLGAYFLIGETVSRKGMLGIGIVVIAILLLGRVGGGVSAENPTSTAGISWSLLTLLLVVCYTLVDKMAMLAFNQSGLLLSTVRGPVYFLLQGFSGYLVYWAISFVRGVRPKDFSSKEWLTGIVSGLGVMASYSLILFVMQREKVSYVVTLRQSSMVIATLIGWLVLKESNGRVRFLISLILVAGLILVATAE